MCSLSETPENKKNRDSVSKSPREIEGELLNTKVKAKGDRRLCGKDDPRSEMNLKTYLCAGG